MQGIAESRNLSIYIERDVGEAYAFLCVPDNFPKWATGLGTLRRLYDGWVAETPGGPIRIRFSERNALGVLDHWVFPAPGCEIYIPMRVVRNGSGCELIFTLFRQADMTDEQFATDAEWVMRDLDSVKALLEAGAA